MSNKTKRLIGIFLVFLPFWAIAAFIFFWVSKTVALFIILPIISMKVIVFGFKLIGDSYE